MLVQIRMICYAGLMKMGILAILIHMLSIPGSGIEKYTQQSNKHFIDNGTRLDLLSLVVDPQNSSILYAGTSNGIYKSTDGGISWCFSGLSKIDVEALAIDPKSTMIYAGTYFRGVYRSFDGGKSWNPSGMFNLAVYALAINTKDNKIIYAGTGTGIYKSIDRGENWRESKMGMDDKTVVEIALDSKNPEVVYARTEISEAIYKSVNGGASWSKININVVEGADVRAFAIDAKNPSKIYAFIHNYGLYKGNKNGLNWIRVDKEDPHAVKGDFWFESAITDFAINPINPAIFYAATDTGIHRSSNGGKKWHRLNSAGYQWYDHLILDPNDPNIIYAFKRTGCVIKSEDGGRTWREIAEGYAHAA